MALTVADRAIGAIIGAAVADAAGEIKCMQPAFVFPMKKMFFLKTFADWEVVSMIKACQTCNQAGHCFHKSRYLQPFPSETSVGADKTQGWRVFRESRKKVCFYSSWMEN